MSNFPDEQDVLTTPSVLECPICNEQYGVDYEKTPRVLKCGHTYCTKCLAKLITIHPGKKYGVKCAFCNALHELSRLDPTIIPINHAVLEIIKVNDSAKVKEEKAKDVPKCEFKGSTCIGTANWVCFDCNPTTNTMFCDACVKAEHERGFEPVARHRRMLMAQVNNPHTASCTYHPRNTATMFSVKLQVFACGECNSRPAFSEQKHLFEPIVDSVQRLRAQAQRMVKYSQDILAKLNVSLANISANNAELGPAVQQTKSQIQEKFAEIVEIIQEREQTLMKHVEGEYSERRQGMEDQLSKIKVAFNEISAAQGSLNSALGKRDIDFLLHYLPAYQAMEKVLNEEDRSLQRTVSYKDIPFYIPQSIMADLRKLGAVGGGCAPYDIEVDVSSDYSNLLQLQWQIPHYANEVQCYEIEYENLPNTSETGLKGSRVQSDTYYNVEPQSVIIPGNVLATYIHGLCPGYKYRFRIRSQNVAGWGMWSKSVVATCDPFPIWIKGTKRIYKICIPKDGYYRLTAKGAKGADGKVHYGGRGAIVSGTFALKAGDVLIILVGTMSTMSVCNTGGGGGSFIALNEISQKNLLIAAGGGGGTRGLEERDEDGRDANLETWGLDGVGKEHGKGGVGGGPGEDANSDGFSGPCWGYGGAGFVQNSSSARSFFEGGTGGQYGGFGGGGAVGLYGGGGGGGYSGGGGGRGGGGGGSYIREDASDVKKILGNESHGEVEIKVVSPPQETLDTFANTNAVLPSPEEVTMQASSESYVSQQSVPPASLRQPSAIPPMMGSDLPPQPYPYTSQYSKSSTSSNSSGTSSVWGAASLLQSLTDYPPVPDTIMEVPLSIVPSDPQQDDREVTLTAIDEAVQVLDASYPLGNSNNTLLQYQPELLHSTQDAITILPPAESGGMAGPSLPPQPVATQTGSSNASSEMSPPQIINTHPNSNANTGTT